MSRIAPQAKEAVEPTIRKRLSGFERDVLLHRQDNNCPRCGETLIWTRINNVAVFGPMIDEHILPLDLGGSNDISNRALYCVPCAKAKTREDIKRIAKARRLRTPRKAKRRSIPSRPFPKRAKP
jgi:5-methylcytosine-specific restriction endonuclease McrA